jgi:NADH-quinone oxidoreductase subunit N
VLLLAQAGAPFTTGFLGKLYVVEAAVRAHSYALAIVAMLTGAVAAAYYLRVVFVLYSSAPGAAPVDEPPLPAERVPASGSEIETAPTAGAALPTAFSGAQLSAATATLLAPAPQEELPAPTERGRSFAALGVAPSSLAGIAVTVLFTVALGIWPGPLFSFVHAASVLF